MTYRAVLASQSAQRNVILALLLAVAASCWAWLFLVPVLMPGESGTPGADMAMDTGSPTMGMAAPAFLAMWAAMMFPTASPMILAFHRIQSGKRERGEAFVSTWLFVAGYIAVWATAGIVAYSGALTAEKLAAWLGLSAEEAARIGGGLLIAAGIYQLTPLKNLCLSECRSPIGFIMTAWREGRWGALRMGIVHGATCIGCCWLLMEILFPLGIMNLASMALVTLVIFAEKALAWERTAVYGTAAVLILYGALVIAKPQLLPTYGTAAPGMDMPASVKSAPMPIMPEMPAKP